MYSWFHGNKVLHTGEEFVYTIPNMKRENGGNYSCAVATQIIGEERSNSINVDVYCKYFNSLVANDDIFYVEWA